MNKLTIADYALIVLTTLSFLALAAGELLFDHGHALYGIMAYLAGGLGLSNAIVLGLITLIASKSDFA